MTSDMWQPIETAPKNGTYILAVVDSKGTTSERLGVIRWYTAAYFRKVNNVMRRSHRDWDVYEDGWWGGDGSDGPYDPSYWVSVPDLPTP
jgi:hypothetical protein